MWPYCLYKVRNAIIDLQVFPPARLRPIGCFLPFDGTDRNSVLMCTYMACAINNINNVSGQIERKQSKTN